MSASMIVYASHHHRNTEKLVAHLAQQFRITAVNAEEVSHVNFASYDLIGFASGIDFGRFYPQVTDLAGMLPPGKRVYALYTCAKDQEKYGSEIETIAAERGCTYVGKYGCKGYNTYGPWKIVGGMNRTHPDANELAEACAFYEKLLSLPE